MNILLNNLKEKSPNIPVGFGKLISHIPFGVRPGIAKIYNKQKKIIHQYSNLDSEAREKIIFSNFYRVFKHAYLNVPFYNELYKVKNQIELQDIKTFADIETIPIVNKDLLRNVPIEYRSYNIKNRLIVNTGGSSGSPFSFYMDPLRYGNEWAHIHKMWGIHGYKPTSLKLNFDGRTNNTQPVHYDFVRNSLKVNIYEDFNLIEKCLIDKFLKYKIEYLHGYPSAIYEFTKKCIESKVLLNYFKENLKACFLSSEFPSNNYRSTIEETFNIPTQSFYGHTETCIMAYETKKFEYDIFQTYGYAEALKMENNFSLVGTSYFNFAGPLIRYDTEDLIEPLTFDNKVLNKFKIQEGRKGDYILDKNGNKISLTGLIFGRHHKLFDFVDHLQIRQDYQGSATILYSSKDELELKIINELFDSSNINMSFDFKHCKEPYKTTSGKIPLKIVNE